MHRAGKPIVGLQPAEGSGFRGSGVQGFRFPVGSGRVWNWGARVYGSCVAGFRVEGSRDGGLGFTSAGLILDWLLAFFGRL